MTIPQPVDAKVHFFASHSWTHGHHREGLHTILRPWTRGLDFQDYSISRSHPLNTDTDPELARELRGIIARMDALVIMAGMYANNSSWMQFEIDMAFAFDVPIIPVLANGQERVPRLPTRLATFPPVRWRGDSIRGALLQCVSHERREAIAYRAALFHALLGKSTQAYTPPKQPILADLFAPQATLPTNYFNNLLRRR